MSTLVTTLVLVGSIVVVLLLVRTDRDQPATRRPARRRAEASPKRRPPAVPVAARKRGAQPLPERVRSALTLLVLLSFLGTALAAGVALVVFLLSLALRQSGSQLPGG